MKNRLAHLALCGCILLSAAAHAQAPGGGHAPGGGPPPGARPPGGPPGAGGPPPNGNNTNAVNSTPRTANVTTGSGVKLGPPGRWWDDRSVVRTMGLSRVQQKKMDAIFDANRSAIVQAYQTFLAKQSALNTLSKSPQVDKAQMFAAIDAVNQARASLAKANTEMLLQVRQQLDPSQVTKLESLP